MLYLKASVFGWCVVKYCSWNMVRWFCCWLLLLGQPHITWVCFCDCFCECVCLCVWVTGVSLCVWSVWVCVSDVCLTSVWVCWCLFQVSLSIIKKNIMISGQNIDWLIKMRYFTGLLSFEYSVNICSRYYSFYTGWFNIFFQKCIFEPNWLSLLGSKVMLLIIVSRDIPILFVSNLVAVH